MVSNEMDKWTKRINQFVSKITEYNNPTIYLIGSYATGTPSLGSDIDFLIFVDHNIHSFFVNNIRKLLNRQFKDLKRKIDCKILSKQDYSQLVSSNYLMISSMLDNAQLLTGTEVLVKKSPMSLRDSFIKLEDQLEEIKNNISLRENYHISAFSLFVIARSFYFLMNLIEPSKQHKSVKSLFRNHFYRLTRIYEQYSKKGVLTSFTVQIRKGRQRSGDFKFLNAVYKILNSYRQETKTKFYKWFDSQKMLNDCI